MQYELIETMNLATRYRQLLFDDSLNIDLIIYRNSCAAADNEANRTIQKEAEI